LLGSSDRQSPQYGQGMVLPVLEETRTDSLLVQSTIEDWNALLKTQTEEYAPDADAFESQCSDMGSSIPGKGSSSDLTRKSGTTQARTGQASSQSQESHSDRHCRSSRGRSSKLVNSTPELSFEQFRKVIRVEHRQIRQSDQEGDHPLTPTSLTLVLTFSILSQAEDC
jgi:hypothetical protein